PQTASLESILVLPIKRAFYFGLFLELGKCPSNQAANQKTSGGRESNKLPWERRLAAVYDDIIHSIIDFPRNVFSPADLKGGDVFV
ncbi:hypothetical protein NPIL_152321, partial [Nephila pilipes]